MLENRLRRNAARLAARFAREGTDAWRLYDRDIPELPYTIDLYGPRVLVTEYVTPVASRLSPERRALEHEMVRAAAGAVAGVPAERLTWKRRERHVSFEREARGDPSHEFEVRERGRVLRVNLEDYLDTGLFLDHRPARARVAKAAAGRSLLNLFCYTGAFTVQAAGAGASRSTSVDLSPTYLAWAGRNLDANGFDRTSHVLVRADVFEFLRSATDTWDLIVLDPPTLSRSKAGRSFDLQKAHPELLRLALARLAPGGTLWFSTNDRRFSLDGSALTGRDVRDVTQETTPPDFREPVHRCWEIR